MIFKIFNTKLLFWGEGCNIGRGGASRAAHEQRYATDQIDSLTFNLL